MPEPARPAATAADDARRLAQRILSESPPERAVRCEVAACEERERQAQLRRQAEADMLAAARQELLVMLDRKARQLEVTHRHEAEAVERMRRWTADTLELRAAAGELMKLDAGGVHANSAEWRAVAARLRRPQARPSWPMRFSALEPGSFGNALRACLAQIDGAVRQQEWGDSCPPSSGQQRQEQQQCQQPQHVQQQQQQPQQQLKKPQRKKQQQQQQPQKQQPQKQQPQQPQQQKKALKKTPRQREQQLQEQQLRPNTQAGTRPEVGGGGGSGGAFTERGRCPGGGRQVLWPLGGLQKRSFTYTNPRDDELRWMREPSYAPPSGQWWQERFERLPSIVDIECD